MVMSYYCQVSVYCGYLAITESCAILASITILAPALQRSICIKHKNCYSVRHIFASCEGSRLTQDAASPHASPQGLGFVRGCLLNLFAKRIGYWKVKPERYKFGRLIL